MAMAEEVIQGVENMARKEGEEVEDIAWREFDIHKTDDDDRNNNKNDDNGNVGANKYEEAFISNDDDDDDDSDDDQSSEMKEGDNQEFMFSLFDKTDDEETIEYEFPNLPKIVLQGKEEYTNSTGLQVWLGSEVLCDYILHNSQVVERKDVLELGAGLGLCGIVAYHLGASKVCMTDGDSKVLKTLRDNVQHNTTTTLRAESNNDCNTTVSCPQLIWGKNLDKFKQQQHGGSSRLYDVIMATDCIYMPQSLQPFFETIDYLLDDDGMVLYVNLCTSQAPIEKVLDVASNTYGFVWTRHKSDKTGNEDVYVFKRKEA